MGSRTKKHSRSLVLAALVATLTLWLSSGATAANYPSTGSATFSDATPKPGGVVTITGLTGPNVPVRFTITQVTAGLSRGTGGLLATTTLGTTTSSSTGAFSLTATIPSGLANGGYALAVLANSTVIASTTFTVVGGTTGVNAQSPTGASPTSTSGVTSLAFTGASTAVYLGTAGALLALGGLALSVARRNANQLITSASS